QAGSLETLVARARWRNTAAASALLLLIIAAMITLLWLSRQAQRLAQLQMNFVAGVSHELRTPLAGIRTAAFNLNSRSGTAPDQVERYGKLIEDETRKLTTMVEQVLRFASGEAGRAIRHREAVAVDSMIDGALEYLPDVAIEKRIDAGLPLVSVDRSAMRH